MIQLHNNNMFIKFKIIQTFLLMNRGVRKILLYTQNLTSHIHYSKKLLDSYQNMMDYL
jgi:hypothetical protein